MARDISRRRCTSCRSIRIVNNGLARNGKQKFHCKACGYYGTLGARRPAAKVGNTPVRQADGGVPGSSA